MSQMTISRFDEAAAQWDNNPTRVALARAIGEALVRAVTVEPSWRALDYGAGTGLLTLNLLPYVSFIVALDSSKGMLAQLQQKLLAAHINNVEATFWDLEKEPLPQGGFDLVASAMTMHHIRDVPLVLGRLASVLRPGGWLAFADLDSEDGSFHGEAPDVFHKGFDRSRVAGWLEQRGLSRVSITDAHSLQKPTSSGELKTYSVFLAVGQKPAA
jgi:ubiquinone/menaquinone biosynthesis C-methylase UbiE